MVECVTGMAGFALDIYHVCVRHMGECVRAMAGFRYGLRHCIRTAELTVLDL